jgi:ABC-type dipeptide/oligopeptide/nickel transport system permease component
MARHLLYRLVGAALVLLAVSFVTFVALSWTPGDAAQALAGESASAEQLDALRADLGLAKPLLVRYLDFLGGLAQGDLGASLVSGRSVSGMIAERLPYTAGLAALAILLAALVGTALGTAAATRAGSRLDTALMSATLAGLAMPGFWLALLLTLLFSLKLRWLPVAGAEGPRAWVLPLVTLALPTTAIVARLVRSGIVGVLKSEYVRTAHAKGVPGRQVLARHALRTSLTPLLAVLGVYLGHLLGGAFVVETIFGWPGLGRLTVQAIFDRDTPVVLGCALVIAAMYLLVNLLVDVAQAWLDPRVRQEAI